MTIKDLPMLDSIKVFFINQQPLDNKLILEAQNSKFYNDVNNVRQEHWKLRETKLALVMKQNQAAFIAVKKEAKKKYSEEIINNATRYLQCIIAKRNVPTTIIHVSVIAWFISQFVDIDETLILNAWEI